MAGAAASGHQKLGPQGQAIEHHLLLPKVRPTQAVRPRPQTQLREAMDEVLDDLRRQPNGRARRHKAVGRPKTKTILHRVQPAAVLHFPD